MAIDTDSPAAKYGQKVLAKGKQALEYVKNLEQQRDELVVALEAIEKDQHSFQTRPCPTCRGITKTLGRPFGCHAALAKVKK